MPVHYIIDKERRLVLSTGEGTVTIQELKAHQAQLLSDADFDASFNQLIDFSTVSEAAFSGQDVMLLARRKVFFPTSRRAIVVSKTAHYGIARQFEVYHGERSIVRVFYDRDAALKWLGIPEDCELYRSTIRPLLQS